MNKLSRRALLGGSTAAAAIAVSQLGRVRPSFAQSGAQSGTVNLYTSRHYDTDERIYDTFARQTGIEIKVLKGNADELIARIQSEGRNSPADLLFTVDAARLWRAEQSGIFQPVDSAALNGSIPSSLRHPDGLWFSLTKRARVVMYNKNTVSSSQLSTYEDLATPKWKGKLAVRSSNNVYNQSLVASLIEHLGESATEEWCRGIVANMAAPPRGGDMDQIKMAASGRAELAIANTYYLTRFAPGRQVPTPEVFDAISVFFPNQNGRGTHVNVSGGGVVRAAPNREGAIRFLALLVQPSSQAIFAQSNSEYPVVPNVPLDPVVARFGDFKEDPVNVALLGRNNPRAVEIMNAAGWR